jgi:phosphatidylglycerol:prolipoprotein diacylglycerol transferase
MGYFVWVLIGFLLALLALRWQPRSNTLPPEQRQLVRIAALLGAIVGAYGLQLPPDLFGWSAPPPPGLGGDTLPLGGRTVLGGLLGGWFGVELTKWRLGVRTATGGDFALPLALALCCGRLGCFTAGCCAGEVCEPGWWATLDAAGVARWPVQLLEAAFHGGAAIVLAWAARARRGGDVRLLAYLAVYAAVRFLLEFWRQHPAIAFGLSWHQWLAIVLFGCASGTCWARMRRRQRNG